MGWMINDFLIRATRDVISIEIIISVYEDIVTLTPICDTPKMNKVPKARTVNSAEYITIQ